MGNAFLAGQGGGGMSDKKIKEYLNSTLGTSKFSPLDKLIPYNIDRSNGKDVAEFGSAGTYTTLVPIWANSVRITAAAGGGGGYANQTGTGGGGGGGAILNKLYTVPNAIKDTKISVSVGSGGGGCYYKDSSSPSGYDVFGPYDGGNTTISALNIALSGGKKGTGTAGGAAGGTGGGAGGNPGTRNTAGGNGGAGVSGAGGNGATYYAGGGGGSLGAGGAGNYARNDAHGGDGKLGGGGGACSTPNSPSYAHGGNGGDGYVKLEWLL